MSDAIHLGHETLRRFEQAQNYNRWIADTIRPYAGRRILEIGAGIGNLSQFFLDRERLVLTDIEAHYIETLRGRFAGQGHVRALHYDVAQRPPADLVAERFDTVICLNVIEHIEDDIAALRNIHDLLQPGGHALLLVPAHQWLYCKLDVNLGHHRRYSRALFRRRASEAGLEVRKDFYFNPAAILGWFVMGKIFCRDMVPSTPLQGFDRVVPLLQALPLQRSPVGISTIAIAARPAHD
ncbi:MAG: class I SAM-dependent methyltransferase [Verrucomicrobia bacterium]|nr:class I SAM-dependent methyltransferase [Verrucomicrobiota bacterium]